MAPGIECANWDAMERLRTLLEPTLALTDRAPTDNVFAGDYRRTPLDFISIRTKRPSSRCLDRDSTRDVLGGPHAVRGGCARIEDSNATTPQRDST